MVVAVCLYGLFETFIAVLPFNFLPPSSAIRVALITCLSRFFCWCSFCVRLQQDLFFLFSSFFVPILHLLLCHFCFTKTNLSSIEAIYAIAICCVMHFSIWFFCFSFIPMFLAFLLLAIYLLPISACGPFCQARDGTLISTQAGGTLNSSLFWQFFWQLLLSSFSSFFSQLNLRPQLTHY